MIRHVWVRWYVADIRFRRGPYLPLIHTFIAICVNVQKRWLTVFQFDTRIKHDWPIYFSRLRCLRVSFMFHLPAPPPLCSIQVYNVLSMGHVLTRKSRWTIPFSSIQLRHETWASKVISQALPRIALQMYRQPLTLKDWNTSHECQWVPRYDFTVPYLVSF